MSRDENDVTEILLRLRSLKKHGNQMIIRRLLNALNEAQVLFLEAEIKSWIGPLVCYIEFDDLLNDKEKLKNV